MADERESQQTQPGRAAGEDKIQTDGRKANAAQPLNAADDQGGPERYPPARRDDGVERSFAPNPEPRQGAGDSTTPVSANEGRLGPGGDPAEGKR